MKNSKFAFSWVATLILVMSAMVMLYSCNNSKKVNDDADQLNSPLNNSYWQLTGLYDSIIHPTMNRKIYLKFGDSSRVSGFAGCNGTGGMYTLSGNGGLKLDQMISTKMACPDLSIENSFFGALEKTTSFAIHADTLLLFDKNKNKVSTFISVADVGQWK